MDTTKLQSWLADHPDATQADVEAAAVVRTPRPALVTYQTVANVWDQTTAATFVARVAGGVAQGNALAIYVEKLLTVGFDATNDKAAAVAEQLVAAQFCTTEQAQAVLTTTSHPFDGVPTAEDVVAARAVIARELNGLAKFQAAADRWNAYADRYETHRAAGYTPETDPGEL